jgi:hypothetical protein
VEAQDDVEKRAWWMGLSGALKKEPPPPSKTRRWRGAAGLDDALSNGVEQVL